MMKMQFLLVIVFRLVELVLANKHIVRGWCLQTFKYSFDSATFLTSKDPNGIP
jgi:hypothetical protein